MKRKMLPVTLLLCFLLLTQLTTCLGSGKVYGKNRVEGYGKVWVGLLVAGFGNVYTPYLASYYTLPDSSTPGFKYVNEVTTGVSFCTGVYVGSWEHVKSWAVNGGYNTYFKLYTQGVATIGFKMFGLHYKETLVQTLRVGDNYY